VEGLEGVGGGTGGKVRSGGRGGKDNKGDGTGPGSLVFREIP